MSDSATARNPNSGLERAISNTAIVSLLGACLFFLLAFFVIEGNKLGTLGILEYFETPCDETCMNAIDFYRQKVDLVLEYGWLIMLILQSAATFSAFGWLIYRAYKTLRTPVPVLIETLGIEVPDAPEVALAGLKSNACTLQWSRPASTSHKQVSKYFIQVNGVNVGESSRLETAIEVTGLKPSHFYNVRVIAVGVNNFQAGSKVLRLSTLCKDGQPNRGDRRPSESGGNDDQDSDSNDDAPSGRGHGVEIQAATIPEAPPAPVARESSGNAGGGGHAGQRRNTGGRKHSPSTAAADQAARELAKLKLPEESMQKLTEKFEAIRKETDETVLQTVKDSDDFKVQYAELTKERDEKRQVLNDREEASEKLKKEVNTYERLNRGAQTDKSRKQKVLKDKEVERDKIRDDMKRWEKELENMKFEKETWRKEKENIRKGRDSAVSAVQEKMKAHQVSLDALEEKIHHRGLEIVKLEAERKSLPSDENDEESQAQDAADKQEDAEWQAHERDRVAELNNKSQQLREIEVAIAQQQAHLSALQAGLLTFHANSSGVDFDPSGGQNKAKSRRIRNRKSRTSTISSPVTGFPLGESPFPNGAFNMNSTSPMYAVGPYYDMSRDTGLSVEENHMSGMSEEDIRMLTAGAPLSPTATSLLPSNIFADDDHDDHGPLGGQGMYGNNGSFFDREPQSPESSSHSASLVSSPHTSSQNLAKFGVSGPDYVVDSDRRSLASPRRSMASPEVNPVHKGVLRDLFSLSRQKPKSGADGPALGSLKHGQSQSLPRNVEEPESLSTKHRRISFSSAAWPNFLRGSSATDAATQGNAPAPARNTNNPTRRYNMFSSSIDDSTVRTDREPSSPRPTSIASSEFPRPSTDSAQFGWGPTQDAVNRASPLATNWSVNAPATWSANPSRRPSFQRGSSSALTTGIASDDDEFLPSSDALAGQTSPPPVGVIGTRPASSHKAAIPKLNPNAPAFRGFNFRMPKTDKEKSKGKGKDLEPPVSPEEMLHDVTNHSSPAASRKSRDTHSIHTQNSMAESHESLDQITSNTTSEHNTPSGPGSAKDKESNTFRQLLRKGSSSKFSISSLRNIGGKKGVGSTANSDRSFNDYRDNSFDEVGEDVGLGRSVDSVTSSPMIGSLTSEGKGKDKDASTPKESKMNWGRLGFKKGKGRESLDVDREVDPLGEEEV